MKRKSVMMLLVLAVAIILAGCSVIEVTDTAKVPIGSGDVKGMELADVQAQFQEAGFTNIETAEKETKEAGDAGAVKDVSVDGEGMFEAGDRFVVDAPVIITYYVLSAEPEPLEVMLEMETSDEDGKPVFIFRTNLPDDTALSLEVTTDDDFDFLYQENLTVSGGEARSAAVTNDGTALNGVYSVGVALFPSEQPESVQAVIGEHGELMTGDCVEDMDTYRYIALSFEYVNVPYDDVIEEIREGMREGFGNNFTLEYNESSIAVETWGDGVAANATLASLGDKKNIDAWNRIVDGTKQACARVQDGILTRCGYGDVDFTLIVLNDANRDNHLLVVTSGCVLYDAVNGIDLISAAAG